MFAPRRALVVAAMALSAVVGTSVASGGATAGKQRIAFDVKFNILTSTGTFVLIPLTDGHIKRATGSVEGSGDVKSSVLLNGQQVTPLVGSDRMQGKLGTLTLAQRVYSTQVATGSPYSSEVGSWSIKSGTGAYAGLVGSGRFAGIGLPNGRVLYRAEGWVRTR